jgi:hypothetical protein
MFLLLNLIHFGVVINMTGATCGARTAYPFGVLEFTLDFSGVRAVWSLVVCVVLCLYVLLSCFVIYCLIFIDLQLLITPFGLLFYYQTYDSNISLSWKAIGTLTLTYDSSLLCAFKYHIYYITNIIFSRGKINIAWLKISINYEEMFDNKKAINKLKFIMCFIKRGIYIVLLTKNMSLHCICRLSVLWQKQNN